MDSRIRRNDKVVLKVFDILGKEVTVLINEIMQPGTYEIKFDGTNFSSGIYFYNIEINNNAEVKSMILLK
jgi:hypothetical protein